MTAVLVCVVALYSCRTFDIQYYDESTDYPPERNVQTFDILPEKADGMFRVVQLTDLHVIASSNKRYEAIIAAVNQTNADLLLFTGDFMSDQNISDYALTLLSQIQLSCPKVAVRGNWEVFTRHPLLPEDFDFRSFFSNAGFLYLADQAHTIQTPYGSVHLYGFDSFYANPQKYEPLVFPSDGVMIILAHEPARFDRDDVRAYAQQPDQSCPPLYMFSGHTHGGHITFFGHPIFTPLYGSTYQSGRYTSDNAVLYVSAGAGQGRYNFRVCAPYDFLVVDIPAAAFFPVAEITAGQDAMYTADSFSDSENLNLW